MLKHNLDWTVTEDGLKAIYEELNVEIFIGKYAMEKGLSALQPNECCLVRVKVNGVPHARTWRSEGFFLEVKDSVYGLDNACKRAWRLVNNHALRMALRELRPDYEIL